MKKRLKNRKIVLVLSIFMLICMGTLIGIVFQYKRLMKKQTQEFNSAFQEEYKYHCAFISESYEDPFWESIYEGAKEEGEKNNIYVENYGKKLSLNYTINERIRMAIAADVDAIILEGTNEVSTTDLINKAIDKDIVVVTVYEDQVESRRRSFIGINKFMMGYNLASKAYECLNNDKEEIVVLYEDSNNKNQENIVLNSGIKKFLNDHGSEVKLKAQIIDNSATYNTEEEIRELLRNTSKRPRVLICTNLIQTQCAYQTIVDLNCVGEVRILGFYSTQSILEAVQNGVVEATLMVDTYQMGQKAVENISEFLEVGYVSDYVAVDTSIINQKIATKILREDETKMTKTGGTE